jgi:hypothetical protein
MHMARWGLWKDESFDRWPLKRDGSRWEPLVGLALQETINELCYEHYWQRGDLVLIDQSRVMHARRVLPEAHAREVYLRMGRL